MKRIICLSFLTALKVLSLDLERSLFLLSFYLIALQWWNSCPLVWCEFNVRSAFYFNKTSSTSLAWPTDYFSYWKSGNGGHLRSIVFCLLLSSLNRNYLGIKCRPVCSVDSVSGDVLEKHLKPSISSVT